MVTADGSAPGGAPRSRPPAPLSIRRVRPPRRARIRDESNSSARSHERAHESSGDDQDGDQRHSGDQSDTVGADGGSSTLFHVSWRSRLESSWPGSRFERSAPANVRSRRDRFAPKRRRRPPRDDAARCRSNCSYPTTSLLPNPDCPAITSSSPERCEFNKVGTARSRREPKQ